MSTAPTLSRAVLELERGPATRGFSPEYVVHQLVADLFDDRPDRGYLYRVVAEAPGEAVVLVLSDRPPRDAVPRRAWGGTRHVDSKPFTPALEPGTPLDFEIRLNATRVVTSPDGRKDRTDVWDAVFGVDRHDPRSPHVVYGEYLRRKLDGVAEICEARVVERGQVRPRRGDRSRPIAFVAANLVGTLRVIDPAAFRETVMAGIGRSKAFGCGLLCLSRPGTVLARRYPGGEYL